jgi:drug/metabolite transporter (DMT)-like permease
LIIVRPATAVLDMASVLAAVSALFYALAAVVTRRLGRTDRASAIAFYTTAFYVAAAGLLGLAFGRGGLCWRGHASLEFLTRPWRIPSSIDLGILALLGLLASVAAYFVSQAYRIGQPATIAPFEYIAVPLSVLWGFLLWGEVPGIHTLSGSVLIIGSGLYLLRREPKHAVPARNP